MRPTSLTTLVALSLLMLTGCNADPPEQTTVLAFEITATPSAAGADIDEFVEFEVTETAVGDSLPLEFSISVESSNEAVVEPPLMPSVTFDEVAVGGGVRNGVLTFDVEEGNKSATQTIRLLCRADGIATVTFDASAYIDVDVNSEDAIEVQVGCGSEKDNVGGGSTVYGDPVIASACDFFEPADIQAIVGHPVTEEDMGSNGNAAICEYKSVGDGMAIEFRADIRSNAADVYTAWKDMHADATVIEPVTWSREGEFRIDNGRGHLFAYVRDDDGLGRDIIIRTLGRPYTTIEGNQVVIPDSDYRNVLNTTSQQYHGDLLSIQTIVDE